MPLELLGALVVCGIGGVVLLVHLLGMSPKGRFSDENEARSALAADYPGLKVSEIALSDDGRAAVLATDRGPAAVKLMGTGIMTRLFAPGEIRRTDDRQGRLRVILNDFGAPSLTLPFTDPKRRAAAKEILERYP